MTRLYQYPEKNEESDQDYEKKRKDFAQCISIIMMKRN